MQWPWSTGDREKKVNEKKPLSSWEASLNSGHFRDPINLVAIVLGTSTLLAAARIYRSYLLRIPAATYIRPGFFRKRSLFGTVTRVGDADNFHLFHTPGGRMTGWGWARRIPEDKKLLKNNTAWLSSLDGRFQS